MYLGVVESGDMSLGVAVEDSGHERGLGPLVDIGF